MARGYHMRGDAGDRASAFASAYASVNSLQVDYLHACDLLSSSHLSY